MKCKIQLLSGTKHSSSTQGLHVASSYHAGKHSERVLVVLIQKVPLDSAGLEIESQDSPLKTITVGLHTQELS